MHATLPRLETTSSCGAPVPEPEGSTVLVTALLLVTTLFVAYAHGADDNVKGVATLFGSDAATYRGAIALATGTTCAGAVARH